MRIRRLIAHLRFYQSVWMNQIEVFVLVFFEKEMKKSLLWVDFPIEVVKCTHSALERENWFLVFPFFTISASPFTTPRLPFFWLGNYLANIFLVSSEDSSVKIRHLKELCSKKGQRKEASSVKIWRKFLLKAGKTPLIGNNFWRKNIPKFWAWFEFGHEKGLVSFLINSPLPICPRKSLN